ncbi:MAG: metallophosphoesterase [Thermomicrobiaceae bacterium]
MTGRDQKRHYQQLKRLLKMATIGAGVAAAGTAYASLLEPRTLLIREVDLAIPTLPPSLDGTRIAFLSDFHLGGPGDPLGTVDRALEALIDAQPDIILLGGDYYDRGMRVFDEPDWSRFPAIAPTVAVPGNHDYHRGQESTERIFEKLSSSGITVLRNETSDVTLAGSTVRVIGMDDPYSGYADLDLAQREAASGQHPRIMLAHSGLIADDLPEGAADLILSGHTHGAQIRFSPFRHTGPLDAFWWLDLMKRQPLSPYRQGFFRVNGSLLYVGNGLGTTSLGLRFLAPPEVAIFRLKAAYGQASISCDDPERYVIAGKSRWSFPGV